jgi:hypothetical protein
LSASAVGSANGADHLIAPLDRESARPERSCAQRAEAAGGDAAKVGDDAGRRAAPEHDGPFPIISMDVPRNNVSILEGRGRDGIGGPREAEAAYALRGGGRRPVVGTVWR